MTLEPILTDYSKDDKDLWRDEGANGPAQAGQVLSETAGASGLRPSASGQVLPPRGL